METGTLKAEEHPPLVGLSQHQRGGLTRRFGKLLPGECAARALREPGER